MENNRSSSDAELCTNAVVKLEPVEFVLCDANEEREEDLSCQMNETYEEGKRSREIDEKAEWEKYVLEVEMTNGGEQCDSLDSLGLPLENNKNARDPFAQAESEEDSEVSESGITVGREVTLAKDQGKSRTDGSCSPQSEKDYIINNKGINLDTPQTPISAFVKEERSFEDYGDELSETVEGLKTNNNYFLRSSSKRLGGGVPVLLLSPKNLRNCSTYDTIWNKQLVENIDEQSLSSCSSASLGYDSGCEDLSYQERKISYYCPKCNKAFLNKASFNKHSACHGRETICGHCDRSFRSKKKLKIHEENLLKCHEFIRSGKLFSDRVLSGSNYKCEADENDTKLSLRLVPTHKLMGATDNMESNADNRGATGDERRLADLCTDGSGARTLKSEPVSIDENSVGPDESTVCCKICRTVFTNKCDLKIHFLTHTERKDCKCNHCGKHFKSEKELNTHTENLLMGHTFLKSGQVSYVSFYGEPFYHQQVDCSQATIDEADIKPIIVLDEEGDAAVTLLSGPSNS